MDIKKFNEINEKIKSIISDYQIHGFLSFPSFMQAHKELIGLIHDHEDYFLEDIELGLINSYNKIGNQQMDFLIERLDSYHMLLWKLHKRIIMMQKPLTHDDLPEELKTLDEELKTEKTFLKDGDTYYVITLLGEAEGHSSTIKISPKKIILEYNDHALIRIDIIKDRISKLGWRCGETKLLSNVFEGNNGCSDSYNNYFFSAEKYHQEDDLRELGRELFISIDTDWITLDETDNISKEQYEKEIKTVKEAYSIYEKTGILPKETLKN